MSFETPDNFGHLVTNVVTHSRTMTEANITTGYDRSSMFSQHVDFDDVDENLCLLYALPVWGHESYRPNNMVGGKPTETCRQWKMVYRWMPSPISQAAKAKRLAMRHNPEE